MANKIKTGYNNLKKRTSRTISKIGSGIDNLDRNLSSGGDLLVKGASAAVKRPTTAVAAVAPLGSVAIASGVTGKIDKAITGSNGKRGLYNGEKLVKRIEDSSNDPKSFMGRVRKVGNTTTQYLAGISRYAAYSNTGEKNMVKYRQKIFTIPEGHYTGSKDLDEVPGTVKVVGTSVLGGTVLGGIAGHVLGNVQDKFDSDYKKGASIGAKTGLAAGIAAKVLLNVMHNPMTSVKFNEVDKTLRRNFGIYSASGFVIGDSRDNRKRFDDAFATNDRNVADYRINVVVQDNQVILYTFQLSDQELKKVSDSLDYYCKKYYGMNYNSKVIDAKINSYSVTITFTNYQVISDFLMEVADELKVKINLLNNKAIVDLRLSPEGKEFSDIEFNNYDLMKIFLIQGVRTLFSRGKVSSDQVIDAIHDAKNSLSEAERVKIFGPSKRKDFDNAYLLGALGNLRFKEGKDYTIDKEGCDVNMSLFQGNLTIAVSSNSKQSRDLENTKYFNKSDVNKSVSVFTYSMKSKEELNTVITKVINTRIIPNIYTKSL